MSDKIIGGTITKGSKVEVITRMEMKNLFGIYIKIIKQNGFTLEALLTLKIKSYALQNPM